MKKFLEWEKAGLVSIEHNDISHRCHREICEFATTLFAGRMKMRSSNANCTEHDGVFVLEEKDVVSYMSQYNPKILRYSRATKVDYGGSMNFGESKGLTFDRVLIFPHKPLLTYLTTGSYGAIEKSIEKVYVAITRARQSVAFVMPRVAINQCVTKFAAVKRW